jgi:hypothetical protein
MATASEPVESTKLTMIPTSWIVTERCYAVSVVRSFGAPARVSYGADDGIRTRDPHLGKVVLYQLSHVRVMPIQSRSPPGAHQQRHIPDDPNPFSPRSDGGS